MMFIKDSKRNVFINERFIHSVRIISDVEIELDYVKSDYYETIKKSFLSREMRDKYLNDRNIQLEI